MPRLKRPQLTLEVALFEPGGDVPGITAPAIALKVANVRGDAAAELELFVESFRSIDPISRLQAQERAVDAPVPWADITGSRSLLRGAPKTVELLELDLRDADDPLVNLNVRGFRDNPLKLRRVGEQGAERPQGPLHRAGAVRFQLGASNTRRPPDEYTLRFEYNEGLAAGARLTARVVAIKPATARAAFDPIYRKIVSIVLPMSIGMFLTGIVFFALVSRPARSPCEVRALTERSPGDRRITRLPVSDRSPQVERKIHVGDNPATAVVSTDGVWVGDKHGIALIDPDHPRSQPIRISTPPVFALALSSDRVWATLRDRGTLISIDRSSHEIVKPKVHFGSQSADVTVGGGHVWVNDYHDDFDGDVTRIHPCTGRLKRIPVRGTATAVKYAYRSLWVSVPKRNGLVRVDPRLGKEAERIRGIPDPQDIAAARGELWVSQFVPPRVARIDPTRSEDHKLVRTYPGAPSPGSIAFGGGAIWQPASEDNRLHKVVPGGPTTSIRAGTSPTDIALGFERIWLPDNSSDTVTVVRP